MLITTDQAIQALTNGNVVAIPTETVYGLAGLISSEPALRKIFALKRRPFFDPLIVHVAALEDALPLVREFPPVFEELAQRFWPGPLTVVTEKSERVNGLITAGGPTVAVRVPRHPLALEILRAAGPFAAPSANFFGKLSPTAAEHVNLGLELPTVDGGPCEVGLESTVVQLIGKRLTVLRPGRVSLYDLKPTARAHGLTLGQGSSSASPGHLKHHYQPSVPLVLLRGKMGHDQLRRLLPPGLTVGNLEFQNLELPDEPALAARIFYSELRRLSENPNHVIVAEPASWRWSADSADLLDRLSRAASFIF